MTVFLLRNYEPGNVSELPHLEEGRTCISYTPELQLVDCEIMYIETIFDLSGNYTGGQVLWSDDTYLNTDGVSLRPVLEYID